DARPSRWSMGPAGRVTRKDGARGFPVRASLWEKAAEFSGNRDFLVAKATGNYSNGISTSRKALPHGWVIRCKDCKLRGNRARFPRTRGLCIETLRVCWVR